MFMTATLYPCISWLLFLTKTLKIFFLKSCLDWDLNFRPLTHETSALPLHHGEVIQTMPE
jgi:hypothetical protein